jgi:hypothetical protein
LDDELIRVRQELFSAREENIALSRDLAEATGFVEALEAELRAATFGAAFAEQEKLPSSDLKRLLLRARTAARIALHPDLTVDPLGKRHAHQLFLRAEGAFEDLFKLAGVKA